MLLNMISSSLVNKLSRPTITFQLERCRHTKHWNPKYKEARRRKVIHFDFPELESNTVDSQDRRRMKMKERGIFPQKQWFERPMYLSCTGNVFEPYIPPEGDGKFSSISKIGAKQNVEFLLKKTKSHQALRKIRKYEEEFNVNEFPDQVTDVYIMAHQALARQDKEELTDLVTEKLFPEMIYNLENKTVEWKFINSLEPAKVVHARCTSLITDNNVFAQVTVRLHTQQILAVYDRFGRLMDGTEMLKKDVFEYVVVEKHISNEYGRWRLHSKIVPSWFPPKQYINKSFVIN